MIGVGCRSSRAFYFRIEVCSCCTNRFIRTLAEEIDPIFKHTINLNGVYIHLTMCTYIVTDISVLVCLDLI